MRGAPRLVRGAFAYGEAGTPWRPAWPARPPRGASGELAPVLAVLLALAAPAPAAQAAVAGPDSLAWRFELGGSTDGTNELYYGALVDTVFLPRRRVSEPEVRYAGVALAALQGTRGQRAADYLAQAQLSWGDKVKAADLLAHWRRDWPERWRLRLDHRLEYRDDRSFDLERRDWRGVLDGRLRRAVGDGSTSLELANSFQLQRTFGDTTGFFLSNLYDRLSLRVEQFRDVERDWSLGATAAVRTFADSSGRDHAEFAGLGRWRSPWGTRFELETDAVLTRRAPLRDVASSRDRFVLVNGGGGVALRFGDRWKGVLRAELDETRYDDPNDTYFDYFVLHGRLDARFEPGWRWSVAAGPRLEWLRAPREPAEDYLESGGGLDLSWARPGAYLSFAPQAGWRDYLGAGELDVIVVQHSSYAFYELAGYFDQRLPLGLRGRGVGSARWEFHVNAEDDARSLYFSLDLRRIF